MDADIFDLDGLFKQPISYRIPVFQRPYAWTQDKQWEPLWQDVVQKAREVKAGNTKIPAHFMGAVILQQRNPKTKGVKQPIVVDGQQRLTTLQLLVAATRQSYIAQGNAAGAERLRKWIENDEDFWDGNPDNQTKVRQSNLNDKTSFQDVIRLGRPTGQQRAIDEAFKYFEGEATSWLDEEPSEREARWEALETALKVHIKLAVVDLDSDEKPHFIFAVLNARAEPLKASDHIKNEIMYRADVIDDERAAERIWGMFDKDEWWRNGTGETALDRIQLDRFLNYWTVMKLCREVNADADTLYREFKVAIGPEDETIERTAADIRSDARTYRGLEEARQPGIELFLSRIRTMGHGIVMPLLLWLYSNGVLQEQILRATRALESYLVRRMICGFATQGINRLFLELIGELGKGDVTDADQTIVAFLERQTVDNRIWPKDRMVSEHLATTPLRGAARRRAMVLEAVELNLRSHMGESLGNDALSIEHIMPEKWETHWPLPGNGGSDPEAVEERNKAVQMVGNLTLVTGRLNSALSNGPWEDKIPVLEKHSSLFLNKRLVDSAPEDWNEEAIADRSAWMAERVIEIWPHADKL